MSIKSKSEEFVTGLDNKELMEAISDGVQKAFWKLFTNDTDAPCADFYDAISKGAAKGIEETFSCINLEGVISEAIKATVVK